jgi:hypothetical protein
MRRHAENLAVLGGAISRRQWSRPVALTEVLRSAIAEVEHYSRVKLVPPIDGTLRGHAVADVIHLVAELVENATNFSPPHTQVLLRAQNVTAGLAVEVEDRGLGMSLADQYRANGLLDDPERTDLGELLRDGRIGLFVVSAIARRHGIVVRLQTNIYGGIQALVILPQRLLGAPPPDLEPGQEAHAQQTSGTARPEPAPALATHASAAIPASPPHPTSEPGVRPQLPRRLVQTHLAPELQQPPAARGEETVVDHDPGLMAAFMQGVTLAETGADEDDGLRGGADSSR